MSCLHWIIHNHPLPSVVSLLTNWYPLVTLSAHNLRTSSHHLRTFSHLFHPLMSHDQVELQRILSMTSNGSFHRGSSATMSGSGSFHYTDTDDAPNPVYSSIPESQVAHHQYKDNQLQHQVRGLAGGCSTWVGLVV